jgi:hypothetical protein
VVTWWQPLSHPDTRDYCMSHTRRFNDDSSISNESSQLDDDSSKGGNDVTRVGGSGRSGGNKGSSNRHVTSSVGSREVIIFFVGVT